MQDELSYIGVVPYETVESLTKKDLQQEMKGMLHGSRECQHMQHCFSQTRHKALQNSTYNTWKLPPVRACKTSTITQKRVGRTTSTCMQRSCRDHTDSKTGNPRRQGHCHSASDMRELLVILTKELEQQGKARAEEMQLLYSLVDIQKLCYAAADDRTTTTVYRLSNAVLPPLTPSSISFDSIRTYQLTPYRQTLFYVK
ncbi:hypothetical protein Bbelb_018180 [Branchiostoma belcheri]|nr:hypothetical protein Bbelb_018180 [Branchiostoma belcheri]